MQFNIPEILMVRHPASFLCRGLVAVLASGLTAGAAHAMTFTNFSATFSCTAMSFDEYTFEMDRNNSSVPGEEIFDFEIRDGAGVVLLSLPNQVRPIQGIETFPAGTVPYQTAPTANPITLTMVSLAGNGLPRQVALNVSGSCADLPPAVVTPVPTADLWALGGLAGALALLGAARVRRQRRG